MQDNPIPGRAADARSRGAEDEVLRRVLDLHPAHLAERELTLDLVGATLAPGWSGRSREGWWPDRSATTREEPTSKGRITR